MKWLLDLTSVVWSKVQCSKNLLRYVLYYSVNKNLRIVWGRTSQHCIVHCSWWIQEWKPISLLKGSPMWLCLWVCKDLGKRRLAPSWRITIWRRVGKLALFVPIRSVLVLMTSWNKTLQRLESLSMEGMKHVLLHSAYVKTFVEHSWLGNFHFVATQRLIP